MQVSSSRSESDRSLTNTSARKEAKRLEKEAKLAVKSLETTKATLSQNKIRTEKGKREEKAFMNTTLKGEKKGKSGSLLFCEFKRPIIQSSRSFPAHG